MYQIFITRKTKRFEGYKIVYESQVRLKIFECEDYEKSQNEYNVHTKSELEYLSVIDYSIINTVIELTNYDTYNHTHRIIKIITLQNF